MGLSASQFRYLSLTARQSDLEYQAQCINNQRLAIASKSSAATKAYNEGLSNTVIRVSGKYQSDGTQIWEIMNYTNLQEYGYQVIGANGESLNPSPYTTYAAGTTISTADWGTLTESQKANCTKVDEGYVVNSDMTIAKADFKGMDIQTLLMSGQGQIVSDTFYNYLVEHGYGTGRYFDDEGNETTYEKLLENFQNDKTLGSHKTVIDWQADVSGTFKQNYYTEDDAQVEADYESKTADLQYQDKMLECQLKQIETEHKAIETEMESLKKVIDKNIENSYKTFG